MRNKERAHNELCYEIFSMVNTQDQKEWPSVLIKIYQRYVKELENRLKSKDVKQKDETS